MDNSNHTIIQPPSQGSSGEFDGNDFSNNIFTDLAPLLTLFGEQVTKQFLSHSMGYGDDILLAMAPLGILTCVVSAIRVGGRRWLRALVGRARESKATAEMEILSNTSEAVCELWSGKEIVRERGNPQMKELIYRKLDRRPILNLKASDIVFDLETSFKQKVMKFRQMASSGVTYPEQHVKRLMDQAPNLTLNVKGAVSSKAVTWCCAVVGILVQIAVLVVAALVTYHWKVHADKSPIASYGFPIFFIGAVLLCIGIFLCSYIIEASTEELDIVPVEKPEGINIIRIQRACTVGDQNFGSYAILNEPGNPILRTSRINEYTDFSWLSLIATFLSLGGYVLQFIGLRAMHWSVAITVLGATLLMTGIRAFVRRGLAASPKVIKLHEGHELSWLALEALHFKSWEVSASPPQNSLEPMPDNEKPDGPSADELESESSVAQKIVEVRKEIRHLVSWDDNTTELAHQLAKAICGVLEAVEDQIYTVEDTNTSDLRQPVVPALLALQRNDIDELSDNDERGNTLHDSTNNAYPVVLHSIIQRSLQTPAELQTGTSPPKTTQNDGGVTKEEPYSSAAPWKSNGNHHKSDERSNGFFQFPDKSVTINTTRGEAVEDILATALSHSDWKTEQPSDQAQIHRWYRENTDLIEDALRRSDLKIPTGFLGYWSAHGEEPSLFGISFEWDCDILSQRSYSPHTVKGKYRLRVHGFPKDESREAVQSSSQTSWSIDINSLAAILSLWTYTAHEPAYKSRFTSQERIRLLGGGWKSTVTVSPSNDKRGLDKGTRDEEIRKWLNKARGISSDTDDKTPTPGLEGSYTAKENNDGNKVPGQLTENLEPTIGTVHTMPQHLGELDDYDSGPANGANAIQEKRNSTRIAEGPPVIGPREIPVDLYAVWIERRPSTVVDAPFCVTSLNKLREYLSEHTYHNPHFDRNVFGYKLCTYSRAQRATESTENKPEGNELDSTPANDITISSDAEHTKRSQRPYPPTTRSSKDEERPISPQEAKLPPSDEKIVFTKTSLARLRAQEIFSAFMLELTASIPEVKGRTRPRAALRGDDANCPRWTNSTFEILAKIVRDSKLAVDEQEAYMLIIPPFHARGLLPTQLFGNDTSEYYTGTSYYVTESSSDDSAQNKSE